MGHASVEPMQLSIPRHRFIDNAEQNGSPTIIYNAEVPIWSQNFMMSAESESPARAIPG